tara:strand:- start:10132 stop:11031 length:900 start_codon:yes stop_codon:yes gene_type:complete
MSVNKFKIPIRDINISGTTINLNVNLDFSPVDNAELIKTKLIDDEIEKAINPIDDYKKVRFFPCDNNWNIIRKFKININFFRKTNNGYFYSNSPSYNGSSYYGEIGFRFDDLFCRTDSVMNSFIRFSYYDTNVLPNNLIASTNIFTQILNDQKNEYGFVLTKDECPVSFVLGDSTLEPETVHEGYYIYWFQDLVDNAPNKEYVIYLEVTYQNAKTGESTLHYSRKTTDFNNLNFNQINDNRFLKVVLKNDNGIYKYRFEPNNEQNAFNGGPGGINLNPQSGLSDLPYLTFWQVEPNIKN